MQLSTDRPYLRASIVDLEAMLEPARTDRDRLALLAAEVERRSTGRARKLAEQIKALMATACPAPAPAAKPQPKAKPARPAPKAKPAARQIAAVPPEKLPARHLPMPQAWEELTDVQCAWFAAYCPEPLASRIGTPASRYSLYRHGCAVLAPGRTRRALRAKLADRPAGTRYFDEPGSLAAAQGLHMIDAEWKPANGAMLRWPADKPKAAAVPVAPDLAAELGRKPRLVVTNPTAYLDALDNGEPAEPFVDIDAAYEDQCAATCGL